MTTTSSERQETIKRKPETIWKLVQARCASITGASMSSRVPFLLALTWGVIWFIALFEAHNGYVPLLLLTDQTRSAHLGDPLKVEAAKTLQFCSKLTGLQTLTTDQDKKDAATKCIPVINERIERTKKLYQDLRLVSLPGGLPKVHYSDLGILAGLGIVSIHLWLFFSLRRENHSLKTFVHCSNKNLKATLLY